MEEWDAYLAPGTKAASPAGGLWSSGIDDMFATSASPLPASGSASPAMDNDPFGFAPIQQPAQASASTPSPPVEAAATADQMLGAFGGFGNAAKGSGKPQTLADMKKNNGFLDANAMPTSQSPSLMMQATMNYYEVLGLTEMAALDDIKAVYKKKSLQLHPDRNPNCHEDDKQMFKLITKAYETLSDPQLRQQYDMELRYKNQSGQFQQNSGNWLNHLGGARAPAPGGFGAPPAASPGGGGFGMGGGSPMFQGGPGMGASPPPASAAPTKKSNDPFSGLF